MTDSQRFPKCFREDQELRQTDFVTDPLKTLGETLLAQQDTQPQRVRPYFSKNSMKSVTQQRLANTHKLFSKVFRSWLNATRV